MKILKYEITKTETSKVSVNIENEEFICVESVIDGFHFITAFIGKGELKKDKKKIEVSKNGYFLNIKSMAGSAELNAIHLLKKSDRNRIVKNSEFLHWLKVSEYKLNDCLQLLK